MARLPAGRLFQDPGAEIGELARLCDGGPLQVDPADAGPAVRPDAIAEEQRREVDDDLVEEVDVQAVLGGVGAEGLQRGRGPFGQGSVEV